MRAWILPGYGGIESLAPGELPDPVPAEGQIVLEVLFAALNPADRYLSVGQYPARPAFPHVLGRDGVGRVVAVGAGVPDMVPGDLRLILRSEVGVTRPGTLAQRVAVSAECTVPLPAGWSHEQAAAAPLVYITAWQALTQWGPLPADALVLVTGASGGVGIASIQLAHALGYTVIALSRSAEKGARLHQLGARWVFAPGDPAWRDEAKAALGRRVDLAIDNVGGEGFAAVIAVMALHGRVSVVGRLAGPVPSFNTSSLLFRRLKLGGVALSTYTRQETLDAWQCVLETLARTGARPVVDQVFPFEQVPAAFARLEAGPLGKVVVNVAGA